MLTTAKPMTSDEVDEDRVVGGQVERGFDAGRRDDLREREHGSDRPLLAPWCRLPDGLKSRLL